MMAQKRKRKDPDSITESMLTFHHYPTPSQFVRHAIRYLMEIDPLFFRRAEWEQPLHILDHSSGTGVWNAVGMELIPDSYRTNVELQIGEPIRPRTACEWFWGMRFQDWAKEYLEFHSDEPDIFPLFDIVWGNFPFKEGEDFVRWGYELLKPRGYMYSLAPINFLGTQERTATLHRVLTPLRVITIPKRLSFTKDGKTDEKEYVLLLHQKGVIPRQAGLDFHFDWSYDSPDLPEDQPFDGTAPLSQVSFEDLW